MRRFSDFAVQGPSARVARLCPLSARVMRQGRCRERGGLKKGSRGSIGQHKAHSQSWLALPEGLPPGSARHRSLHHGASALGPQPRCACAVGQGGRVVPRQHVRAEPSPARPAPAVSLRLRLRGVGCSECRCDRLLAFPGPGSVADHDDLLSRVGRRATRIPGR